MSASRPVGEVIAGLERFRLVRSLGRGASGAVYEVEDAQRSGARLALKLLASVSPHEIFALKEEFRGLQDVEHPNLLRLIELGNVRDRWFLVMELVDGIPPTQYTRPSPGSFDEARLRAVFAQITRGLHALHSVGKVHRDIKPSNVLVEPSGRVVILDFGLIRDAVSGPEEDYLVGTLAYMAPEQAFREAVAPPADLYSLGIMLFECLTGRVPFDAASIVDVTTQKVQGLAARPRALAPNVPDDLDELAVRLLDPEPSRRPAADAILAVLEGRRASVPVPLERTSEKRRVSFVGRAAELRVLEDALDDVRRGQTVTVIIEGESGLGKTALERELIRRHEKEVLSIHGRCHEHEALPYKGIDGVMDSLADQLLARSEGAPPIAPAVQARLSRVFPAFARIRSSGASIAPPGVTEKASTSRAELFAVVRSLIGTLALERTLIMAIDDWHWSDADSVALLRDLLRPPDAPPIFFLATTRPLLFEGDDSPLQLPGDVRRLRLERLSPTDSVSLAAALLGESASPSDAQRVADDAAGNPLFLDELVRDNDHRRETGAPALLDDVIRARVVRLAPPSRALLEVLCVAGVAIPVSLAGDAAGLAPGALAVAAATLRAGHLARAAIVEGGEGAEPYHDRIREAVAGGLSPEEARTRHAALARALERASWADDEAIARHHIGAGDEARALRPLLLAADRAQDASAFALAARLYERALSLSALPDAERPALAVKVATALSNAGLGIQAASAYERAAALVPRGEALALQRRAAEERLFAGEIDAGIQAAKRVLSAVKLAYPDGLLAIVAGILWWRFLAALYRVRPAVAPGSLRAQSAERLDACTGVAYALAIVDPLRGAYFQSLSVLLALRLGDARRLPEALALHATSVAAQGAHKTEKVQALYAEARSLLGGNHASESWGFVEGCAGASAYLVGRFEECAVLSESAMEWISIYRPGNYWDLRTVQTARLWSLGYLGRLRELAVDSERLRREADARGDLAAATGRRVGIINLAWLAAGESGRARRELRSALAAWPQAGVNVTALWAMHAEGQVDLYEGTPDEALKRIDAMWGGFRRALVFQVEFSHIEARDLRGRVAIGAAACATGAKRRRLIARARSDASFLGRRAGAFSRGFAFAIEGGALALEGETDRAVASYRAALAAFESQGMQLAAAAMKRCIARLANEPLLEQAALEYFEAEGVTDARAMTRLMAPAFDAGHAADRADATASK